MLEQGKRKYSNDKIGRGSLVEPKRRWWEIFVGGARIRMTNFLGNRFRTRPSCISLYRTWKWVETWGNGPEVADLATLPPSITTQVKNEWKKVEIQSAPHYITDTCKCNFLLREYSKQPWARLVWYIENGEGPDCKAVWRSTLFLATVARGDQIWHRGWSNRTNLSAIGGRGTTYGSYNRSRGTSCCMTDLTVHVCNSTTDLIVMGNFLSSLISFLHTEHIFMISQIRIHAWTTYRINSHLH